MKKFVTVTLLITSFFFLVNFSASTAEDDDANLSIEKKLAGVNQRQDGSFDVSYKIQIKNIGEKTVNDVVATDNLQSAFDPHFFKITNFSGNNLLNAEYNGITDLNLLKSETTLKPSDVIDIDLAINFNPGNDAGPFENFADVEGLLDNGDPAEIVDDNPVPDPGEPEPVDLPPDNDIEPGPVPEPEPETDLTPREFQYMLVNADTDQILYEITEGMIINIDDLPTSNINVLIIVNPGNKGSLIFDLNGVPNAKTENREPFTLGANNGDDYYPWEYNFGEQNLAVTAYTEDNGQGEIIGTDQINFTIIGTEEEDIVENTPTETATADKDTDSVIFTIETTDEVGEVVIEETETTGRVLAATGIEVTDSILIGLLIILAVFELNVFELEERFTGHFLHSMQNKLKKKRKEHSLNFHL